MRCSLPETVRRLASVGWAVRTSSTLSASSSVAICCTVTPRVFSDTIAAWTDSPPGAGY